LFAAGGEQSAHEQHRQAGAYQEAGAHGDAHAPAQDPACESGSGFGNERRRLIVTAASRSWRS
jgi:hypothetical protein